MLDRITLGRRDPGSAPPLSAAQRNGPAFRARLRAGTRIVKVNGASYSTAGLLAAVRRPRALE